MGFLDDLFGSSSSSGSSGGWMSEMEAAMGATLFTESNPVLKQLFGQLSGIMSGGAPSEMMVPWIQTAVTNAQSGLSGAEQSAKSYFGSLGLGKDPVSAGILAQLGMQGQQAVANIPSQLSQQFLMAGLGNAQSTIGQAGSFVGGAAGSQRSTSSSSSSGGLLSSLLESFVGSQSGQDALGAGATALGALLFL
jgi:hypothetical protein